MNRVDVGQVIGNKYVLVRLLGAGAMGEVWVARHQALQQTFAVKVMVPPSDAAQAFEDLETLLRRFRNEAQIAAALSRKSRHIAAVTDYGTDEDAAYLVMELLDGRGLDAHIGSGRRLHAAEVHHIVSQIAKGLSVAHAEGVTHRDLKPANVFLTKTEEGEVMVKLLDFGIARLAKRIVNAQQGAPTRLTMKGLVLGSPAYMSPEQAMAEALDHRTDVWSLAVLAYEALAGVTPFQAKDADETILRICNFRPTPLRKVMPEASAELEAVFTRAFQPPIDERFQSVAELEGALAAVLPPSSPRFTPMRLTSTTAVETVVSNAPPLRLRRLVPAIAAGAGIGIVLAVAAFLVPRATRSSTSAPTAVTATSASVVIVAPPPPATSAPAESVSVQAPPPPTPARTNATLGNAPKTKPSTTPAPTVSVDRSAVF